MAHDAAVSKIEMEMRAWAADKEPELIDVLEHAKDTKQRVRRRSCWDMRTGRGGRSRR